MPEKLIKKFNKSAFCTAICPNLGSFPLILINNGGKDGEKMADTLDCWLKSDHLSRYAENEL